MEPAILLIVIAILIAVGYFVWARRRPAAPGPIDRRPQKREELHERGAAPGEAARPTDRKAAEPTKKEPSERPPGRPPSLPPEGRPTSTPPPVRVEAKASLRPSEDVDGMRKRLARSRSSEGFFGRLRALLTKQGQISPELLQEIEEVLLTSDVGVKTTETILERLKQQLASGDAQDGDKVWAALRAEAINILEAKSSGSALEVKAKPTVILLVGVNGAGKTTTIGKLATKLKTAGYSCLLAAGDTFRAAAVQQLVVWGKRVGCEVATGAEGSDPASVIFDAIRRAQQENLDVVLADTAGRLQTKVNLMREMEKIARSAGKALEGAPHEILLVLDATNGQNAISQAREFKETLGVTGIVLTKLDGTAKGGVVLGISHDLGLPVRFVGLGERPDDLYEFSPTHFVEALLGRELEAAAQ